MLTRTILLSGLVFLAACQFVTPHYDGDAEAVQVSNDTAQRLVVYAMTDDVLALMPSELRVAATDPAVLHPGGVRAIAFKDIPEEFNPGDRVVFHVYASPMSGADTSVFHIAASPSYSFEELEERSFEVHVRARDIGYRDLFGDPYRIHSSDNDPYLDIHPPRIADGRLEAWVSFSGCSDGTFAHSYEIHEGRAEVAVHHDYPETEIDCERLNFEEIRLDLDAGLLAQPSIVLLNPSPDADPFVDAFVLKP